MINSRRHSQFYIHFIIFLFSSLSIRRQPCLLPCKLYIRKNVGEGKQRNCVKDAGSEVRPTSTNNRLTLSYWSQTTASPPLLSYHRKKEEEEKRENWTKIKSDWCRLIGGRRVTLAKRWMRLQKIRLPRLPSLIRRHFFIFCFVHFGCLVLPSFLEPFPRMTWTFSDLLMCYAHPLSPHLSRDNGDICAPSRLSHFPNSAAINQL